MPRESTIRLTPRQSAVLARIRELSAAQGYAPTMREIQQSLGFRSPNAAQLYVNLLVKRGYLTREPGRSRTVKIVGEADLRQLVRDYLSALARVPVGTRVGEHVQNSAELARLRKAVGL